MDTKLFLLFLICHFIGDFSHCSLVMFPSVLKAKSIGAPLLPILLHAGVHGICVFLAVLPFFGLWMAFLAFLLEWSTHTGIDVLKGRLNVWIPSLTNPKNIWHWWSFGLDQMAHMLVLVGINVLVSN
jgi:hypothetical protein